MRKWITVAALCVTAVTCARQELAGSRRIEPTGTYKLQTINDTPLPYPLLSFLGSYVLEQTSGSITLNEDGTFIEHAQLRETIVAIPKPAIKDTAVFLNGTWQLTDSAVVLTTTRDRSVLTGFVTSTGQLVLELATKPDSVQKFVYQK